MIRQFTAFLAAATLAAAAFAQPAPTEAEVRKVDQAAGKVTLKHGEIANLDMPPMTMVFTVRDKALLANLKPGDKVSFTAEKEDGLYVVTTLQPR